MKTVTKILKSFILSIFFIYEQFLVKILIILGIKTGCKFYPTCSEYGKQAFSKFNPIKALILTLTRISKCLPWKKHTHDPLP